MLYLRRWETILWQAGVASVVLRTGWLLKLAWPFTTDDAYITLRYSQHLAAGHGLVWNIGEPAIEGFSNFLSVLGGAAAILGGVDPVVALKVLGVAALGVASVLLYHLARLWLGRLYALLPPILFTAYYGTVWWAASGLETALYISLALASIYAALYGSGSRPAPPWESEPGNDSGERHLAAPPQLWLLVAAGALAALAALARPEGVVILAALAAALLLERLRRGGSTCPLRRTLLPLLGGFAALYVPYAAWHWGYFGAALPHAVACKAAWGAPRHMLLRGAWHAARWLLPLLLVAAWRPRNVRQAVLWLIPAGYLVVLLPMHHDVGYANRYFLLALGCLFVLAAVAIHRLARSGQLRMGSPSLALAAWLAVATVSCFVATDAALRVRRMVPWYAERTRIRVEVAAWLNAHLGAGGSFAIGDSGLVPYSVPYAAIDLLCLNNGAGALPQQIADDLRRRRPEFVVLDSRAIDSWQTRDGRIVSLIRAAPWFQDRYVLAASIANQFEAYHYLVYRLGD